jgi:hypothetical protein
VKSAYPTPWQRIVRAAHKSDVLLHYEEVRLLADDEGIRRRAALDDDEEQRARLAYNELTPQGKP